MLAYLLGILMGLIAGLLLGILTIIYLIIDMYRNSPEAFNYYVDKLKRQLEELSK